MNDLKVVLLTNGAEYIGEYKSLNNSEIKLSGCYKISAVPVRGIYTIILVPFSFYSSDTDIIISRDSVVGSYDPSNQILTLYNKVIDSKLDYSEFLSESLGSNQTLN